MVRSLRAGMPLKVRQNALARVPPVSPKKRWNCRRRFWPHHMGNAVCGNEMMRRWPSVLKAAVFLKREAMVRDFWAELAETCDKFDMCVPVPQRGARQASGVPPRQG